MALTFTQADLDALKEAYLTGALRVRIGDREIVYRNQADLEKAMETVQAYLEEVSDDDNPSTIRASFSKGAQ